MPRAAGHVRHGRGHDQRAGVGLLSAGPRAGHLPASAQGRHRRRPGDAVALGRPGTPAGRAGRGGTEPDRLQRVHRLLGGEPMAWLVRRVPERMATGRPLTGTVTLTDATPEQRRAAERLTGRAARSGASLSVSLDEVDRILRDSGAAPGGLADAVTQLTGPVQDRNQDRAKRKAAWDAAFTPLDEAVDGRQELAGWRGWLLPARVGVPAAPGAPG